MEASGGFSSFYNSKELSDLRITFSGRVVYAHQVIMCSRSKWFDSARMSGMKEASSGTVTLEDDDPDAVESMLQYCYGMDYLVKSPKYSSTDPECSYHLATLYITADKYFVEELKAGVLEQLRYIYSADTFFKDAPRCLAFLKVLKLVIENLPGEDDLVKELAIGLASEKENAERLWEQQEDEFAKLLDDMPDLAAKLLKRMLKSGTAKKTPGYQSAIRERKARFNWN